MARSITSGYYGDTTHDHYASYGTASSGEPSRFIPEIFAKKTLVQFYNESTAVQLCNTDYEGDIKASGDSVVIRKDPTVASNDYVIGGTLTYEVPVEDAQTMLIDQMKSNSFRINTVDQLQSDIGLPNRFQEAAKESMKQLIDSEMFNYMVGGLATQPASTTSTLVDSSNMGATAGAVSAAYNLGTNAAPVALTVSNIQATLVEMNAALAEAKSEGNWFCMNPAVAALIKLSDLRQADVTGDGTGVIRTGLIGEVDGSKIYVTNNMPIFSTTTTHSILAGNSQFCSFASQIIESEVLPIPDDFGKYYRSLQVYGRRVVQPTAAALAVVSV